MNFYRILIIVAICSLPVNLFAKTSSNESFEVSSLPSQMNSLRLVGTAVAQYPKNSIAVVEDQNTKAQYYYREGANVGNFIINDILRDKIILNAGDGAKIVKLKRALDAGIRLKKSLGQSTGLDGRRASARKSSISLSQEMVASALSNIDSRLNNVYISSGTLFNQPKGFRITSFDKKSIFSKLGLRNGDLVLAINNQKINNSKEAKSFFQKIREGGDIDVRVRRRARTHHIHLSIE